MPQQSPHPGESEVVVPFRDLRRLHGIGAESSRAALLTALDSADFARPNRLIREFEERYAEFCGVRHVIATASGSSALLLAYLTLGVGPGDNIVTVPNTFVATAEAALLLGAEVRLADIDPATHTVDESAALDLLTPRTKAVVPLHTYGRLAAVDGLADACRERGIALVEEACHAHGAVRGGRSAGSFGDCAVYSFGPTKTFAGMGEGGAVVTDDDELADRLRAMNSHGLDGSLHTSLGLSFRMHPMEAAYLTARLELLPGMLSRRREIAARYNEAFSPFGVVHNTDVPDLAEHGLYVYVIDVPDRESFCRRLTSAGVGWDIHYRAALHQQPAHRQRFRSSTLPACEGRMREIVSLPMIAGLTEREVRRVVDVVTDALGEVTATAPERAGV
ncbi:aminotransferase class I/II-fold pyridoxal phosphate-dependent enzyme [Streptomyces sp. DW26H14]|uniref:aminotransferase class I/II-fold pyridoxal phosphate-dependent enzyme n=1 Tax=Streptomyces sp. DW26H14 TaxID=3435395 RepID=UPI00403D726E